MNFFNPYNPYKSLVYYSEWKKFIDTGVVQNPIMLSLDVSNLCTSDCIWCNSKIVRKNKHIMSKELFDVLINLAKDKFYKSVCIAGGGEPLTNKKLKYYIDSVYDEISLGIITNGYNINNFTEQIYKCRWVGISVDAGTKETFYKLKKVNHFDKIIDNIKLIREHKDITFKYLIWPDNINEIFIACSLAKNIGVKTFHCRPADSPWFDNKNNLFSKKDVFNIDKQIEKCYKLEDENFKVYCIKYKFDNNLNRLIDFRRCWAGLFTITIYPNGEVGLCCDRRGDPSVYLCHISELKSIWGTEYHINKIKNIDISKCHRCTYRIHNLVFENLCLEDKMYMEFI